MRGRAEHLETMRPKSAQHTEKCGWRFANYVQLLRNAQLLHRHGNPPNKSLRQESENAFAVYQCVFIIFHFTSASFLAEISGHPEFYLLSLSKKKLPGSKYPKNILFNFEKGRTALHSRFPILLSPRLQPITNSVAVLVEISLRSPGKLLFFNIPFFFYRIKVSENKFILF